MARNLSADPLHYYSCSPMPAAWRYACALVFILISFWISSSFYRFFHDSQTYWKFVRYNFFFYSERYVGCVLSRCYSILLPLIVIVWYPVGVFFGVCGLAERRWLGAAWLSARCRAKSFVSNDSGKIYYVCEPYFKSMWGWQGRHFEENYFWEVKLY
jgi:hypothetical protein